VTGERSLDLIQAQRASLSKMVSERVLPREGSFTLLSVVLKNGKI